MSCASFLTTSILATGFIDQMRDLSKLSGEPVLIGSLSFRAPKRDRRRCCRSGRGY